MKTWQKKTWRKVAPLIPARVKRELLHVLFFKSPVPRRPQDLTGKINWRLLFDRREILLNAADKLAMKRYVSRVAPEVKIPETLWVGTDIREILDKDFGCHWILKPATGSGKAILGRGSLKSAGVTTSSVDGWLFNDRYLVYGEWAYSAGEDAILLERLIGDHDGVPPNDYRFFVFDGVVGAIQVDTPRSEGVKRRFYTPDWEPLSVLQGDKELSAPEHRPASLASMLHLASKIGGEFDFIRVDLYDTPQGIYFGELTPYPASGLIRFSDDSFDLALGQLWELPEILR